MANHRVVHGTSHYGALVAKKLRSLRDDRGWTIEEFIDKLFMFGVTRDGEPIPKSTAYSYEQGKDQGGADLPMNMVPIIGMVYGYKHPYGWMPNEFPEPDDA